MAALVAAQDCRDQPQAQTVADFEAAGVETRRHVASRHLGVRARGKPRGRGQRATQLGDEVTVKAADLPLDNLLPGLTPWQGKE